MPDILACVPQDRRPAARAALAQAFGPETVSAVAPVTGGASGALTYRVEADGRAYLLRLETPVRNGLRDPRRSFACMTTAAEAGLAPALHHADPETGVAIMDFVDQKPLADYPGGRPALARDLGRLIARLQATPAFPPVADYPQVVQGLFAYIRGSGLFAPGLLTPHAEVLTRLCAAYRYDGPQVSSHNDVNPRNILFDGERLWLIDWELSFRSDPLVDIAILAIESAPTPELEAALFEGWLGHAPDAAMQARYALVQRLTTLFYACLLLAFSASLPREAPDSDLTALTLEAFTAALAEGRLSGPSPELLYTVGKMRLADFLQGADTPEFEDALAKVHHG
ncbi:choline/ethanolamine kinase family protein [Phenylobacterium sp.]|uniref:choline/ethanolamine kinase family protein n=1 Tax=Phenylobacterium sp. TaxID=1871053 RepID=UPI002C534B23|nr:phosphotransferase [Phenylobacterium sp.]HLZ73447.1 phosphotransferase [Phenylobacterium sp.]